MLTVTRDCSQETEYKRRKPPEPPDLPMVSTSLSSLVCDSYFNSMYRISSIRRRGYYFIRCSFFCGYYFRESGRCLFP